VSVISILRYWTAGIERFEGVNEFQNIVIFPHLHGVISRKNETSTLL